MSELEDAGKADVETVESDPAAEAQGVAPAKPGPKLLISAGLAVLWFLALLVATVVNTKGLSQVAAGFGGLITIAAVVVGAFQRKLPVPNFKPDRRLVMRLVILIWTLAIGGSVAWGVVTYQQANAEVDVTTLVSADRNTNVLPGKNATFDIPVSAERNSIRVTFSMADHNKSLSSCAPLTELSVAAEMAGVPSDAQKADAGMSVRFALLVHVRQIRLTVTVENIHDDQNCAVDLFVTNAVLVND